MSPKEFLEIKSFQKFKNDTKAWIIVRDHNDYSAFSDYKTRVSRTFVHLTRTKRFSSIPILAGFIHAQ